MITPKSINVHPINEFVLSICPSIINAAIEANTLSIDKRIATFVGGKCFCAIVCKVKPKPMDNIPV